MGQARHTSELHRRGYVRQGGGRTSLCAKARVFGDDAAQCFAVGECEIPHALGMLGALTAEIGEVITGAASGRTGAEDITLFDSTGIALQDIACSCALLTAAEKAGLGTAVEL